MTFSHEHKNYLQRLLSMEHENIASSFMMQESLSFVFYRGFQKKKAYGLHVFMCSCHRALLMKLIVKGLTNSLN